MNSTQQKLKAVKRIKKMLASVSVVAVANQMGCTRQNIYKHLHEDRAATVSLPHLKKIAEAIEAVKKQRVNESQQIIKTISNAAV